MPSLLRDKPEGSILVFAPEAALIEHVTRHANGPVYTTDYLRTDVDFPGEDIQRLTFPDHSFAALFCNHVLEHIPDDLGALRECARVLRPDGVAVFTIPGDYDRQATRVFDRPDANGHLRHYGLDVLDKMRAAFVRVDPIDMSVGADPRWHIHPGDLAFVCRM
jgi:SAM-dependent methyltransferase